MIRLCKICKVQKRVPPPISHINARSSIGVHKANNKVSNLTYRTRTDSPQYKKGFNTVGEYQHNQLYRHALEEARQEIKLEKEQEKKSFMADSVKIEEVDTAHDPEEKLYRAALKKARNQELANRIHKSSHIDSSSILTANLKEPNFKYNQDKHHFNRSGKMVRSDRHHLPLYVNENSASKIHHLSQQESIKEKISENMKQVSLKAAQTKAIREASLGSDSEPLRIDFPHDELRFKSQVYVRHDQARKSYRAAILSAEKPQNKYTIIEGLNNVLEIARFGSFIKRVYFTEKSMKNLIKYFPVALINKTKIELVVVSEKDISNLKFGHNKNNKLLAHESETFCVAEVAKNRPGKTKVDKSELNGNQKIFPNVHLVIDNTFKMPNMIALSQVAALCGVTKTTIIDWAGMVRILFFSLFFEKKNMSS